MLEVIVNEKRRIERCGGVVGSFWIVWISLARWFVGSFGSFGLAVMDASMDD